MTSRPASVARRGAECAALLRRRRHRGGAVFVLYLITLSPATAMWDTSEYITAAYTLGIPHPPGNPFFVLLGHVFTLLPIAPTIASA